MILHTYIAHPRFEGTTIHENDPITIKHVARVEEDSRSFHFLDEDGNTLQLVDRGYYPTYSMVVDD